MKNFRFKVVATYKDGSTEQIGCSWRGIRHKDGSRPVDVDLSTLRPKDYLNKRNQFMLLQLVHSTIPNALSGGCTLDIPEWIEELKLCYNSQTK